jgi:microcystin-dependent protein
MATITGLTAERMLEIEGQSVVEGEIVNGHLILTKFDGTTVDAGPLPPGPQGPVGPAGGQIPGEIKMWPGSVLPSPVNFGKWVWADGAVYDVATYPKASANIAAQWRTFAGASDPGSLNFRVPDLRGLIAAGMDAMPGGGARANRLTRSVAIVLAGRTGEEIHTVTVAEMPVHAHSVYDPTHAHVVGRAGPATGSQLPMARGTMSGLNDEPIISTNAAATGIGINNTGGGSAHENMQPTVFVPYIVKLDD